MSASCDISGLLAGLGAARDRGVALAVHALDVFGEHVIGDSQEKAPVDTGALKASGTTEPARIDGGRIVKALGHNLEYAAAVHERLDLHHDQGEAKFLEKAIRENADKLGPFVAGRIKAGLGG